MDKVLTNFEFNYYKAIADMVENLDFRGLVSKNAVEYLLSFKGQLDSLSPEIYNAIYSVIDESGFQTIEDVQKIIDAIKEQDVDDKTKDSLIEQLIKVQSQLHTSIKLSADALMSNFSDSWKNTGKELEKITKGFNLEDLPDFIAHAKKIDMDLDISDFIQNGEKFFVDFETSEEYLQKWFDKQNESINSRSDRLKEIKKMSGYELKMNIDEVAADLGVNLHEIFKYDEKGNRLDFQFVDGYNWTKFWETINKAEKEATEAVEDLTAYTEMAQKQIEQNFYFDHGKYVEGLGSIKNAEKLFDSVKKQKSTLLSILLQAKTPLNKY